MRIDCKRALAALLALMLLGGAALAMDWPEKLTPGQEKLRAYIGRVNENLGSLQAGRVNALFELYTYSATLGVTASDDASIPEGTELAFILTRDSLQQLVLRTTDIGSFPKLAAACVQAATSGLSLQDCLTDPVKYGKEAQQHPEKSFRQTVIAAQGERARAYYAYYPNQYRDGANWIELTLIFAFEELSDGVLNTVTPDSAGADTEYAGYLPQDDGDHLEVFVTPTPEPDSPAGGYWE